MKYLWYLNPAGAIQKDKYYRLDDKNKLIEANKVLVPKFYPFHEYSNQADIQREFDRNSQYPVQNGYVFELRLTKHKTHSIVTYVEKDYIVLLISNKKIVIDAKTKIRCKRFINYCNVEIENEKRKYTYRFNFPFHYLFFVDGMLTNDDCSPFYFLMKEWTDIDRRKSWIASWLTGRWTDRWFEY